MRGGGCKFAPTHIYIKQYTQIFTKITDPIINNHRCDIITTSALLFSYYDIFFLYFYSKPIVELTNKCYNSTMENLNSNLQNNYIESYINLEALLSQQIELQCNDDFLSFVRLVAPTIVSDFKMGRHIEIISNKLQQVENGEIKRLMVFLPPRSSKSVVCSKLFPAWYIGRNPKHELLTISHSDQLASDFGRSVRDIVNMEMFQKVFRGVALRSDVRAAGKWKTNHEGTYYAAGVRSQIAGRGAHVAILDDAMSEEDAISSAGRRFIKEWYPAGLRTRIMPDGAIVIINTRYHYDDLCGWLLKQQENMPDYETIPWDVVRIPAWLDDDAAEALTRISQGDLRKALTALQVSAALSNDVTRELIYETSATAPPESLHQYLKACRDDGFHSARRRLRELLDKYGLAGTDFVNQLHRELYSADFLSEESKLDLTEWMAEVDYRLVEGGGEQIQLDALTARLVTHLKQ